MRGDNHLLAVTTATDEATGEVKPLFAFPIQVCKATESKEPNFEWAAPSGAPRKQAFVDEATGELIGDDECKRGVRVGDAFYEIPDEDIKAMDEQTKLATMVALGTVDLTEDTLASITRRITGYYYIQSPAKGGSPKAYKLLYEALLPTPAKGRAKEKPAKGIVTKRTARSRQKLCLIYADAAKGCLAMIEVAFAKKLREPDAAILAPQTAAVEQKQVEVARKVVATLPDGFAALESEVDEVLPLREQLISEALASEGVAPTTPKPVADTTATDNLSAALEASLEALGASA